MAQQVLRKFRLANYIIVLNQPDAVEEERVILFWGNSVRSIRVVAWMVGYKSHPAYSQFGHRDSKMVQWYLWIAVLQILLIIEELKFVNKPVFHQHGHSRGC